MKNLASDSSESINCNFWFHLNKCYINFGFILAFYFIIINLFYGEGFDIFLLSLFNLIRDDDKDSKG